MYTIKQAAIRTGVNVPLLRAWERRYGIPTPARTDSGYRLYDDGSIDRVLRMRRLVDSGWPPSQAAQAIIEDTAPDEPPAAGNAMAAGSRPGGVEAHGPGSSRPATRSGPVPADEVAWLNLRFLGAARALDDAGMESALSEGLALLGVDTALERFVLPALVDIGAAWARGELSIASEHAASSSVMRRLAGLYEAAATPSSRIDCLIGLPPGSRHEIGALAFAVACRRVGLRILYLGADVPVASWVEATREHPDAAVALGAVTSAEADSAAHVAVALRSTGADLLVAIGGANQARAAGATPDVVLLPPGLRESASVLARRVAARYSAAERA
jgi:DNA-binding transcriptional MerR regulator/methanogenic corrinoid protein MtbC1